MVEPAAQAFAQFADCGDPLGIVVAADSALHNGVLSRAEITTILDTSRRRRRVLQRIDGSAESGLETIARVRLRASGVMLRTQVPIGRHRVDILVGDRLVIELDGQRWHDTASSFESDRHRDVELATSGYLVLRFTARRVMSDWAGVERQILTLIRRGDHRWRGRDVARSAPPGRSTRIQR
jgi:very-short-patch-repair endonuclease